MNTIETAVRKLKRQFGLESKSPMVRAIRPVYHALLETAYKNRGLARRINGERTVYVRPSFRAVDEEYEPHVFQFLKTHVSAGHVILEVGAHVGLFSVLLAGWSGPSGRVFAFEPTPRTNSALRDHVMLNGVDKIVEVVPLAVSDRCGRQKFFVASDNQENTLSETHSRVPTAKPIDVEVTTIDRFCVQNQVVPSLIKIDIEGFEIHALRGARETMRRHRPLVVVEMHPMNWPETGIDKDAALATLDQLGVQTVALNNQRDPLTQYGHVWLKPRR